MSNCCYEKASSATCGVKHSFMRFGIQNLNHQIHCSAWGKILPPITTQICAHYFLIRRTLNVYLRPREVVPCKLGNHEPKRTVRQRNFFVPSENVLVFLFHSFEQGKDTRPNFFPPFSVKRFMRTSPKMAGALIAPLVDTVAKDSQHVFPQASILWNSEICTGAGMATSI